VPRGAIEQTTEKTMQRRSSPWRALGTYLSLSLSLAPVSCGDKAADGKGDEKKAADDKADTKTADAKGDTKSEEDTKAEDPPKAEGPCPESMALIDGGTFFIGTQKESGVLATARPSHKVRISSFCIDKNEVTAADYDACVEAGKCEAAHADSFYPQGGTDADAWVDEREKFSELCNTGKDDRKNHPINCVTWYQASKYCEYKGGKLPTEAQWEFAARGSDGRVYPWGDEPPSQLHANTCGEECIKWRTDRELSPHDPMFEVGDEYPGTSPVGAFAKGTTPQGVTDLIGNVFEWTGTRFAPYQDAEDEDPSGPEEGDQFVIRGGAYNSFMPDFTDPALRFPQLDSAHPHAIGFRCAAEVQGG
jgi:formylglycine-generating enzyme required for sulfatase activity